MIIFFILSILSVKASAFELSCEFAVDSLGNYRCNVVNTQVTDSSDRFLSYVYGTHLRGKNNGLVSVFFSNQSTFNYMPIGLKQFFPNLNAVVIYKGGLKVIYEDDLDQFGEDLLELWLYGNKLQYLDFNIFKSTPNLQYLDLSENRITYVEDGIFDVLPNLQFLGFDSNPCYSGFAKIDDGIDTVIRSIENYCKDTGYVIQKSNQQVMEFVNNLAYQFSQVVQDLFGSINEVQQESWEQFENLQNMFAYGLTDINSHINENCKSEGGNGSEFIASKLQQLQVLVAFRCFPGYNGNGIDTIDWK